MGDLKKKRTVDYIAKTDDGEEILIEHGELYDDEDTIARLRAYIKRFYEKQLEEIERKEKENTTETSEAIHSND